MPNPSVRKTLTALAAAIALALAALGCAGGERVTVFAAASLEAPLSELAERYSERYGVDVRASFGGSQALARQIALGAPADLFFSAGAPPMRSLVGEGLVNPEDVASPLSNELVIVAPPALAPSLTSLESLAAPGVEAVAMVNPELGPAGWYAARALSSAGLRDALRPKTVETGDVRAALAASGFGVEDAPPSASAPPPTSRTSALGGIPIRTLAITLQVAVAATLMDIPLALALGWLVVKKRVRGRFILDALASLPLALPPVAIGYALLLVVGPNGPVGRVAEEMFGARIVLTWFAAALAAAAVSFPLMARAFMSAMDGVDERTERAARTLGAGPMRVFFTITLPSARRGVLAGALLGFVRALSEFGATIVVAGNVRGKTQTLPLAIYENIQLGRDAQTLILVSLSIALAVATIAIHNRLLAGSGVREKRD